MNQILLVEDDKNLSDALSRYLISEGFLVTTVFTLNEARDMLKNSFSLIVLDWMLPDGQGIDLLKELNRQSCKIPVIMLTSRTDLIDKVLGLESGANDYMTKPFEPRELCARIRVQLRKSSSPLEDFPKQHDRLEYAEISLDLSTRSVTFKGYPVNLAKMEFDLLHVLLESPNRVFPREALLNRVWGYEHFPTTRTVDNHIVQLRLKLNPELIETVRGVGYRLKSVGCTKKDS